MLIEDPKSQILKMVNNEAHLLKHNLIKSTGKLLDQRGPIKLKIMSEYFEASVFYESPRSINTALQGY